MFLVGDDDQSIYAFRGANYENIKLFKKDFPEHTSFTLAQNYRSTQFILDGCNRLISHNGDREKKNLFSDVKGSESDVQVYEAYNQEDEVRYVLDQIELKKNKSNKYSDFAILYRSSSLLRNFEIGLIKYNIPYKVYGGVSYLRRREIKDIIAYLKLIVNDNDIQSFKRIANVPSRGIGQATLTKIEELKKKYGLTLFSAIDSCKTILPKGKVKEIVTRFPPEPNAYLHIGHARAMITDFELAECFNGKTNLRFDDTNPAKEDSEFVDAILKDIEWLGYHPANIFFGSDYFDQTYELAIKLIKKGLAYVCDLNQEEIAKYRGDLSHPGIDSPYRNRSVEENLKLFNEMREGKYADGEKVLRAKIDMAHPNINMRDPVLYRILHMHHHRQGDKWCIYPMYDFAHPIQDAIEGITHSCCSLEYDNHRILYDWVVEKCEMPHVPHQYEFGRLNITNTIMSKRYLRELVNSGKVTGWKKKI